jgi:hypothetical protein
MWHMRNHVMTSCVLHAWFVGALHNCTAPLVYFGYMASFSRNTPEQPPGRAYQKFVNLMWIADTTCLAGEC